MTPVTHTLRFDDGATTEVTLHRASGPRCVVIIPALGVPASYYGGLAEALVAAGLCAVQFDLRGHGASSSQPRRDSFGYGRLTADLLAVLAWAQGEVGAQVTPLGHSLGGHLALLAAAVQPRAISRLATVAAASPHHVNYPVSTRLGIFVVAAAVRVSGLLGHYPGQTLGFGGTQPVQLMREWSRFALRGELGGEGLPADPFATPVRVPVLAMSIANDTYATAPAVDRLMRFVEPGGVTREHLDAELDPSARDHFRWVRRAGPIVARLAAWLDGAS